jgi:putative transcriptional regulator
MKKNLLEKASIFLLKKGFTVKSLTRSCFDILARNKERILLIKVLEDANSISHEFAEEMHKISACITATPMIISEKASDMLQDNVVYTRFDICTLNLDTFMNCINNKLPLIKRTQAGLTASLLGDKLKEKREQLGYSLNYLSKSIGVTSRMVSKYENEDSEVTINKAMKIYDIFGQEVFNQVDIFSKIENMHFTTKTEFSKKYIKLGFNATDANKVPFDIIAKKEDELILTEIGDKTNPQMQSLSELLDADNLVIFKKKKPKDMPAVTRKEFLEFEQSNQLIKFLKEF